MSLLDRWFPPLQTPDVLQDEPAHGVMLRLSHLNGIPRMSMMEAMTGLELRRIRTGQQLVELARVAGCQAERLSDLHYKKLPARTVEIRGEVLRFPSDVLVSARRLCVGCLEEAFHHRFWWDLAIIATCPRHSIVLTETCSCGQPLGWRDGAITKCAHCPDGDVRRSKQLAAQHEEVVLDRWILGRFSLKKDDSEPELLSGLPITSALETIERIAALGLTRHPSSFPSLGLSRRTVWTRGFKCVAEGRVGNALDQAYRLSRQGEHLYPDISTAYGPFWGWLTRKGGERFCSSLSQIVQEHSSTIFNLSVGRDLPAVRANGPSAQHARRRCAPEEFGDTTDVRVRPRSRQDSWTVGLDVEGIRSMDEARPFIDADELRTLLNVSSEQLEELLEVELLSCREGRQQVHRRPYVRAEVQQLLDKLRTGVRVLVEPNSNVDSVVTLGREYGVSLGQLVSAMHHGELPVAALRRGDRGLRALLVRLRDFLDVVEQQRAVP